MSKNKNKGDGLNVLANLLDRVAFLERRIGQLEQELGNITISGPAVNALNVSALRTLEQVIHAAITPQPVAETLAAAEETTAVEQAS